MANIQFSENEKSELRHFYQLELNKTLKRVADIKGIIGKLNGKTKNRTSVNITKTATPRKRTATSRKRTITPTKTKSVQKQYKKVVAATAKRKPIKWSEFVPTTIKTQARPMSTREILTVASKKFRIQTGRKEMKSLAQTLRNMKKAGRLTSEKKQGYKEKYYNTVS